MNKKRIIRLLREINHPGILVAAMLASIFAAGFRQIVTYFLGQAVDVATQFKGGKTWEMLEYLVFGILILLLLDYASVYLFGIFTNKNTYQFRSKTVKSVISMPFFEKYTTGDLVSRINSDIQKLERFFSTDLQDTGYKLFVGIFAAMFAMWLNYKVALVLIVVSLVTAIANYRVARPVEKIETDVQAAQAAIGSAFHDAMHGHQEIKAYGLEALLVERFRKYARVHREKTYDFAHIDCLWGAIEVSVSILMHIGVVFLCLIFVLRGEMTLGDVVIFQQLGEMIKLLFRINFININQSLAVSERVFELWDHKQDQRGTVLIGHLGAPVLSLQHVRFTYPNDEKPMLKDISFDVHQRETIAIVGESGGGKTTLIYLLCGLLAPESGRINLQGVPLDQWDAQALYQHLALVDQSCTLFPVSLFENIACGLYGRDTERAHEDQIRSEVYKAAAQASLEQAVNALGGYDANVGEMGSRLSGGERQRIAIARALIKSPDLIVMDEPTSSLDAQTENNVMDTLWERGGNVSMIIVAHRLSTIRKADRILVIDDGMIAEQGDHETLLAQKGRYYELYQHQIQYNMEEPHDEAIDVGIDQRQL